jgi:hypothetical protein
MQALSGIAARLLLIVIVTMTMALAFPGVQAIAFSTTPPVHPAGCHGHGPAAPASAPADYQCCVNGHHAAIPGRAFSRGPLLAAFSGLDRSEKVSLASGACEYSAISVVPSISPPGGALLRI